MSLKGAMGGLMGQVGRMFGAGGDEDPTEQVRVGGRGEVGRMFGAGGDEDHMEQMCGEGEKCSEAGRASCCD